MLVLIELEIPPKIIVFEGFRFNIFEVFLNRSQIDDVLEQHVEDLGTEVRITKEIAMQLIKNMNIVNFTLLHGGCFRSQF